jgi:hypothetical protein
VTRRTTGRYERTIIGGEEIAAFVPLALPPTDPPLDLSAGLAVRLRAAEQALVRLEVAGAMEPSLDWFIYAFVRKEAVVSSQIEGTLLSPPLGAAISPAALGLSPVAGAVGSLQDSVSGSPSPSAADSPSVMVQSSIRWTGPSWRRCYEAKRHGRRDRARPRPRG